MVKKCECLPNADHIAYEMKAIANHTQLMDMQKDADYITGMLFVVEESGLVDGFDETKDILSSAKNDDRQRFGAAVYRAAEKIIAIDCSQ